MPHTKQAALGGRLQAVLYAWYEVIQQQALKSAVWTPSEGWSAAETGWRVNGINVLAVVLHDAGFDLFIGSTVGHDRVPPADLIAHPLNFRKHPQKREALAAAIRDRGLHEGGGHWQKRTGRRLPLS